MSELQPVICGRLHQIAQAQVVEGDIGDPAIVRRLWGAAPQPTVLAAAVACQPYSSLGDQRGGRDPSAMCLPRVLQAALLLQSSTVVIECVPQAAQDEFVRTCLDCFCWICL